MFKKKSKNFLNFLLEPSWSKVDQQKKGLMKTEAFGQKLQKKYHEMEHTFKV